MKALLCFCSIALSGCVAFEHPPAKRLQCDTALTGRWSPIDTTTSHIQSDQLFIVDDDCTVILPAQPADRASKTSAEKISLLGFNLDENHYLVFSLAQIDAIKLSEIDVLPSTRILVRYQVQGDRIQLHLADLKKTAALIGTSITMQSPTPLITIPGNRRASARWLKEHGDAIFIDGEKNESLTFIRVPKDEAP